ELPPLSMPGSSGAFHGVVLEALRGISRNDIEAPQKRARARIPRTNKTARTKVATAVADHDFAVEYARRSCDGIRLALGSSGLVFVECLHGPGGLAGAGVE